MILMAYIFVNKPMPSYCHKMMASTIFKNAEITTPNGVPTDFATASLCIFVKIETALIAKNLQILRFAGFTTFFEKSKKAIFLFLYLVVGRAGLESNINWPILIMEILYYFTSLHCHDCGYANKNYTLS